jgi:hypothetical protein
MEITRDRKNKTIHITQKKYINEVLSKYLNEDDKPSKFPLNTKDIEQSSLITSLECKIEEIFPHLDNDSQSDSESWGNTYDEIETIENVINNIRHHTIDHESDDESTTSLTNNKEFNNIKFNYKNKRIYDEYIKTNKSQLNKPKRHNLQSSKRIKPDQDDKHNKDKIDNNDNYLHDYPPIYDVIGSLRFIADRSRPDLLYPINYLSRFMLNPNEYVYIEIKRLLTYIKGTINHELVVGGNDMELYAMVDSSFVHTGDSKSQIGYGIFLDQNAGCITSYSKRSDSVALSTTQAETDSLTECIKEIIWFRGFLESIHFKIIKPTDIHVDNKPVVILSKDGNHLKRSKHFVVKLNWIKEMKMKDIIQIIHISTEDNHSDIFTKALSGSLLRFHTVGVLGEVNASKYEN